MSTQRKRRLHPALKHGAFSATAVLPCESQADFDKLHRDLIAELAPSGVLEDEIVSTIARMVWRKQNLPTLHIAEKAQYRAKTIRGLNADFELLKVMARSRESDEDSDARRALDQAANS